MLVELLHEISVCHRGLKGLLDQHIRPWQLSDVEFLVLWLCEQTPPPGPAQNDLAEHTGVSSAQMSGVVEHLRQRGWLVAQRAQPDRRRQLWQLTASGSEVLQQIKLRLAECWQDLNKQISPRDGRSLGELLPRLAQAIEEQAEKNGFDGQGSLSPTRKEAQHATAWRRAV
jgi:DNA-binding MarR family transcriptional regulator